MYIETKRGRRWELGPSLGWGSTKQSYQTPYPYPQQKSNPPTRSSGCCSSHFEHDTELASFVSERVRVGHFALWHPYVFICSPHPYVFICLCHPYEYIRYDIIHNILLIICLFPWISNIQHFSCSIKGVMYREDRRVFCVCACGGQKTYKIMIFIEDLSWIQCFLEQKVKPLALRVLCSGGVCDTIMLLFFYLKDCVCV